MQSPPAGKRSELALSFKVLIPAALMFLLFIYFSCFAVLSEASLLSRQLFALLLAVPIVSTVFCFYAYRQASTIERQRQRVEGINRVLIQISSAASSTFDLDALYRSIHLSLGEIIDVSNFFIALYDRETDAISFPYYRDEVDTTYPMIGNIHRSGALTAKVIRTAATVLATREEILEWAAGQGEPPVGTPAALWLGVPLKIKNEVIGVMVTQSYTDPHHFDETDVGVFVSVSDQVAMAIERKIYEMQLKEARDALEARVRRRTNALVKINLRLENEIRKQEQIENILRESEARLLQSERLAATGQLAASIAHEINSPLQGVTSLLNVMRREHGRDNQLAGNLELIQGAFKSISKTVRNLLDLNRPGKEKNQPMHIQEVIVQTAALVKGYLKDNDVRLDLDLPPDLPLIMGSLQELSQVFMNLITNSVESLNADPTCADRRIAIKALTTGSQVVVQVTDTGIGISAGDMSRVFDAFFTSKKTMGMGVGLSICHRIIEGHNGTIEVRNRPDRGAAFTIRLPANNLST